MFFSWCQTYYICEPLIPKVDGDHDHHNIEVGGYTIAGWTSTWGQSLALRGTILAALMDRELPAA